MISKDDLEIECQIIGSFLIDSATHDFIDRLKADDFIETTNQRIFKAITELHAEHNNIDIFTVHEKSQVPISHLVDITNLIASTSTIESNIKVLKNKSNRRKLIQKANKIIEMAKDNETDIETIKNNALKEIEEIGDIVDNEVVTLKQGMFETVELLEKRYDNRDDKSYYTGISKLDKATAGLHPEELTTIGARPGVGKTIIGMQIGLNIARNKKTVMYTSLEMSVSQLCERIISANSGIDGLRLRLGDIKDHEWEKAFKAASLYSFENFLIDKTSRNPQHIRAKIIKYKPDLVIIDYLQLLQSTTKQQNREREIATITRDLKLMTLEFKIPIIILSQLNRNAEGNRPTMADLRESGAIEQDSDNIIFLHEPNEKEKDKLIENGIYTQQFFQKLEEKELTLTQLIIEKQRNGPVGTFEVVKVPKLMKFVELEG